MGLSVVVGLRPHCVVSRGGAHISRARGVGSGMNQLYNKAPNWILNRPRGFSHTLSIPFLILAVPPSIPSQLSWIVTTWYQRHWFLDQLLHFLRLDHDRNPPDGRWSLILHHWCGFRWSHRFMSRLIGSARSVESAPSLSWFASGSRSGAEGFQVSVSKGWRIHWRACRPSSHYYRIFNGGERFWFTVAGIPITTDQRSRLIVALTVVGVLGQPPRLMHINGGGCFNLSASFKWLTVAVACYLPTMVKIFQN
jgi:hypothetical protein